MNTLSKYPSRAQRAAAAAFLALSCVAAQAQTLQWAQFTTLTPFGSGGLTSSQLLPVSVSGAGRGSGVATLTMSVSGGSASWNGFGVGRNDDGYFPAPDLPQVGITFMNGAPGYLGGVPAAAQAAFTAAYNLAGGPSGAPMPPTDRAAVYADSGTGTTLSAQWNFSGLQGGKLPAGSWFFVDGVDQGERVTLTGPSGWISAVHTGDSTLPRAPNGMVTLVSSPTFPSCAPAIASGSTTLQLDGRYGDLSQSTPGCSPVPVPVAGQTVGYTKGIDSVGVWVRTAIDLSSLSISALDVDVSPPNSPDNNFLLGFGLIAATFDPPPVPGVSGQAQSILVALLLLAGVVGLRRRIAKT